MTIIKSLYRGLFFVLFLGVLSPAYAADDIKVVVSIKPLHGLVQMVLGDVGDAVLLMPDGVSPHDVILRPSDSRHLVSADLVVIIDRLFETSYARALRYHDDLLADHVLEVSNLPHMRLLDRRVDHEVDHQDDHEDDHQEHGHDEQEHGHEESVKDLHVWMLPTNALAILDSVTARLSHLYPNHAEEFAQNNAAARAEITAMDNDIMAMLTPIKDVPFIVYHDAYIYFEERYGLTMVASVLNHHDAPAEIARIRYLRQIIETRGVQCIFHEPQFSSKVLDVIDPDSRLSRASLDPLGTGVPSGAEFYPAMMRQMAENISMCLR
jgi:zinc transport system substrate-binding protein